MVIVETSGIIDTFQAFSVFVLSLAFFGFIVWFSDNKTFKNFYILIIELFITLGLIIVIIISSANPSKEVYNNPINIDLGNGVMKSATISENVLKKEISKATNSNKIVIEDRDNLFKHLHKGKFISFKALKNNDEILGNVYFTKNDMVVIVNGASEKIDKEIRVPTK